MNASSLRAQSSWLSAWIACSIAASRAFSCAASAATPSAAAPAAPAHEQPRPTRSHPHSGVGGEGFAYGWAVEAWGGAGGHRESGRGAGGERDGQFYVQLKQEDGAGSRQSVQYTADAAGYHPLTRYSAAGPQHQVSSSFALGEQALQLLHGGLETHNPSHAPINAAIQGFPGSQQYPDPRDYYLVTSPYVSPPSYINAQIQGIAQFSVQESNNNALAQYGNGVASPPVKYVVHHPTQPQPEEPQGHSEFSSQEDSSNDRDPSRHSQESTAQLSNPTYDDFGDRTSKETNLEKYRKPEELTTPLIQVFTNQNCTDESHASERNLEPPASNRQSAKLYADVPAYDERNAYSSFDESFGVKVAPVSSEEKANKETKSGRQRFNSRSERIFFSTATPAVAVFTTVTPHYNVTDSITKLVASTQDLISNDDLININRAAEDTPPHNDDILKPKSNNRITKLYIKNNDNTGDNKITVSAKIGKLIDTMIEHQEQHQAEEARKNTQNAEDPYRFATPIVVQGSTAFDFKSQIRDNIVSTVIPYLEDGYELASVRNELQNNANEYDPSNESEHFNDEDSVKVTPRPVSQKFLAPLTVGLRLIHSNSTEVLNNVNDDHDVSDSELISDTVAPDESRGKTIVEVQQSIPIEFTEINDIVIQHDDSRDGKLAQQKLRSLHRQYNLALESSKKIQKNMNQKLYRYGAQQVLIHPHGHRSKLEQEERAQEEQENNDYMQKPDSSDIQTEIDIHQEGESQQNERKEYISAYNNNFGEKLIQPIIIEKEVPITKFVDRFIEKRVPYPQPIEVLKEVEVEKPVPYPVTVEKIVNRPYEVTRYVDRPRNVLVPHPVPYEVKVPYPVEKKVYVDRAVHVEVPVEKIVEKHIGIPVPTPVGIPVPVEQTVLYPVAVDKPYPVPYAVDRPVHVDRIVEKEVRVPYAVEQRVPYPVAVETKVAVPYPVEKRVPYPVDRIVEKPVTVTKYVDRPYHVGVPVPHPVAVPQPYPVDRIVEKRVPYPVDRVVEKIVEKKVEVPVRVNVPYPVEKVVEKIVTKYVDKPYPVEKRVPYPVPYEKIVEKKVPYPVEVKVPYEVRVPYHVEKTVEKPVHIPYRFQNDPKQASYAIPGPPYHHYPSVELQYGHSSPQNYVALSQINPANTYANAAILPPPPAQTFANPANNSFERGAPTVKTTQWGNLYASSYQYIKPMHPDSSHHQNTANLGRYIGYLTGNQQNSGVLSQPGSDRYIGYLTGNQQNSGVSSQPGSDRYIGYLTGNQQNSVVPSQPGSDVRSPPSGGEAHAWAPPRLVQWKLRRADRTPRLSQLRIEYGGFKPPLVPSTEVDLDGLPVKSEASD